MPISIIGQDSGRERLAAEKLAELLKPRFRQEDNVFIVVGAKCHGERRQDIDLLVFAALAMGFVVRADELPADKAGLQIYVNNFALVLEVKDHTPEGIRITGSQVQVEYQGKWSDVTKQVFEQAHAVKSYLNRSMERPPFILAGIWLRNLPTRALPSADHNILGADLTATGFIRLLVRLSHSQLEYQRLKQKPYLSISSTRNDEANDIARSIDVFCRPLPTTRLDRRKLELVCQKLIKDQQYADKLGEQLLMFRGRGGAGKTIRLLQLAKTLHDDRGWRVLFLTYNKSLVADVRRTLAILGVGDKVDDRTIAIRTGDSFFFSVLTAFGFPPTPGPNNSFPEDYDTQKQNALKLLQISDPAQLRDDPTCIDNPDVLGWDLLLIDEGQDWPAVDRDLLFAIFGPDRLVVANGVDQFVRIPKSCDWMEGVKNKQLVPLRKSLRLKSNLCRFVEAFAAEMSLPWDLEINNEVAGGRVIIVKGPYTQRVHERIMEAHREADNQPVDSLFCVTGSAGSASFDFPARLSQWGSKVWDGTTEQGRESYPTEVTQVRIVKYESCRGLEGWTVVCLDLDHFFERKRKDPQHVDRDLFLSEDELAKKLAARWCLIPFTRAMDTLVLQAGDTGPLGRVLEKIARDNPDFIEFISAES